MSATGNEAVDLGKHALFQEERLITLRANVLFPFCIQHLKTLPASANICVLMTVQDEAAVRKLMAMKS